MKYVGLLLWNLPAIIASAAILAISVLVGVAVFSRYLFFFSLTWVEELLRYLFLWMAFFGGAVAVKDNAHFRMGLLPDRMSPERRRVFDVFAHLCFLALGVVFLVVGFEFVSRTMNNQSPALNIPMGLAYSAIPISGAMIILYSLVNGYNELTGHSAPGGLGSGNPNL